MTQASLLLAPAAHSVLSAAAAPQPSVLLALGLLCLAAGLARRMGAARKF